MNVVLLFNGLGNQMSQYAFYLAKRSADRGAKPLFFINGELAHNGLELETIFHINIDKSFSNFLLEKFFLKYIQKGKVYSVTRKLVHIVEEKENYSFDASLLKYKAVGIDFYWGGWHSEKYFKAVEPLIRNTFVFDPNKLNIESSDFSKEISKLENSCSLHIRRGDYLKHPYFNNIATLDYYKKAIAKIENLCGMQEFFVFSDDVNWCQSQFSGSNFHFVDCNFGNESWQDMYLMTLCHNHINANSTFSWWGAWLCPYKDSVTIVPKQFTTLCETPDIYPENWIKID